MDSERRAALLEASLTSVARRAFGRTGGEAVAFPGGAALLADGAAFVLVADEGVRSIGPAMAWAHKQGAVALHVLAAVDADRFARQAAEVQAGPQVWWLRGADVEVAEPRRPVPAAPPPDAPALAATLAAAGLDVVVEPGRLAGELRGLEVARVVAADGVASIEVGVGQADRELTAMLHGELSPDAALERAVAQVAAHRHPGAPAHPLNRLARERWLRWVLRQHPERVGASRLEPVCLPRGRHGLRERDIACARGALADGTPALVVCSVGIDPDFVPLAAEARLDIDPDAALVLVAPERDLHPLTYLLAAGLRRPAHVVGAPGDWATD